MRKCNHCAEWVDQDLVRCPYCDRDMGEFETVQDAEETTAPFVDSTVSDLIDEFREKVNDEPFHSVFDDEPEPEPEPVVKPEAYPSPFDRPEPDKSSFEPAEEVDLASFRSMPLDGEPIDERLSKFKADAFEKAAAPKLRMPTDLFKTIGRLLIILVVVGGGIALLIGPIQNYLNQPPVVEKPTATPTPLPEKTATRRAAATLPPITEPTTTEETQSALDPLKGCVDWSEVSVSDEGEEMCVYGTLKRWFASGDIPFIALFSEETGTFYFVDRERTYPEYNPGDCLTAEGPIELMRGVRPFIDVKGSLDLCPTEG
jgi:hypothetical protein